MSIKEKRLSGALQEKQFGATLLGLEVLLRGAATRYPEFAQRLTEKDLIAQFKLRDGSQGRYFTIAGGKVRSTRGFHRQPDVSIVFNDAAVAAKRGSPGTIVGEVTRTIVRVGGWV